MNAKNKILKNVGIFISSVSSIFNLIKEGMQEKLSTIKKNKENPRFDINMDDVKKAHEQIPKKVTYLVIGISLLIIVVMTIIVVNQEVSSVNDKRLEAKSDVNITEEGVVDISIDEQGWKYNQSRKIDNVTKNNQEAITTLKKSVDESNHALKQSLSNELNTTTHGMKVLMDSLGKKIERMEASVSSRIEEQKKLIEAKIKENNKEIERTVLNTSQTKNNIVLTDDMKFLPPPLNTLKKNYQAEPIQLKENTLDSKGLHASANKINEADEYIYIEAGDDEYDYMNTSVDEIAVETTDIQTIAMEINTTEIETELKLHIMKGLVNATLLTGVNVATFGGSGSSNPTPVLFSVDGNTFIANNEEQNIDDCLVSGVATGNINTSKADILLTDISCSGYSSNGEQIKIEKAVKGWVVGEDGSFGLDGKLMDSSGTVITKMIAVELIQSLTEATLAMAQTPIQLTGGSLAGSALVPTNSPAAFRDNMATGISDSVGGGLENVYEHYSQILSGMYPTISVRAGKKISILFKGGEDATPKVYDSIDISQEYDVKRPLIKEGK